MKYPRLSTGVSVVISTLIASAPASAWILKPHGGEVYIGTLMKYGHDTGKPCELTILSRAARPDVGHHCFELRVTAPGFFEGAAVAVPNNYYTTPIQTCATSDVSELRSLMGQDSKDFRSLPLIVSFGKGYRTPFLEISFKEDGHPVRMAKTKVTGFGLNAREHETLSCEGMQRALN